jgi:hypothetical protein
MIKEVCQSADDSDPCGQQQMDGFFTQPEPIPDDQHPLPMTPENVVCHCADFLPRFRPGRHDHDASKLFPSDEGEIVSFNFEGPETAKSQKMTGQFCRRSPFLSAVHW